LDPEIEVEGRGRGARVKLPCWWVDGWIQNSHAKNSCAYGAVDSTRNQPLNSPVLILLYEDSG
jgi:hypothetical protein